MSKVSVLSFKLNFKLIFKVVVVLSVFFSTSAYSKAKYFYDKGLPISKGAVIKVVDFDSRLGGVYQVFSTKFPGEGHSYTRAENLSKSIRKFNKRAVERSPASIVGKTFKLDQKLETVLAPPLWPKRKTKKDISKKADQ